MRAASIAIIALFLTFLVPASARAFSLQPMTVTLEPSGPGAIATFRIHNEGPARTAVQVRMFSRSWAPDGAEINGSINGDFTFFPSRMVLDPGASGSVKIKWNGEARPAAERAFRLVAEQVPVEEASPSGTGLKILFRYIASVYVMPSGALPDLVVVSAVGATGPAGKPGIMVKVANSGSRHVIVLAPRLSVSSGSGTEERIVEGTGIAAIDGVNYLPGQYRQFFVPMDGTTIGALYAARLEYDADQ